MLVKATGMSAKLGVKIKELHRIAEEGETFEVSPIRFKILSGENRFRTVFAREVKEVYERDDVESHFDEKVEDVNNSHENNIEDTPIETNQDVVDDIEPAKKTSKKRGRKKKN